MTTTIATSRPMPTPCYGSVAQLATYAGISKSTVRRLVESGDLKGFKIGRRLVVPFAALDRYILERAAVFPSAPEGPDVPPMAVAESAPLPRSDAPDPVEGPTDTPDAPLPSMASQEHSGTPGTIEGTGIRYNPFGADPW